MYNVFDVFVNSIFTFIL